MFCIRTSADEAEEMRLRSSSCTALCSTTAMRDILLRGSSRSVINGVDATETGRCGKDFWVNGGGERSQTVNEGGRRCVQPFIGDAEHASALGSRCLVPGAVADDLLERNAVASATPRGDDDVRIG